MDSSAAIGSIPIALNTWLLATFPELHAAPALTATPARSSAIIWISAGIPTRRTQEVLTKRGLPRPCISTSGTSLISCFSNRFLRYNIRSISSRFLLISRQVSANPTAPETFSVPALRRLSCPPPTNCAPISVWGCIASAPIPLGPPILCADTVIKSTPSAAMSTGSFPSACTASQ